MTRSRWFASIYAWAIGVAAPGVALTYAAERGRLSIGAAIHLTLFVGIAGGLLLSRLGKRAP